MCVIVHSFVVHANIEMMGARDRVDIVFRMDVESTFVAEKLAARS